MFYETAQTIGPGWHRSYKPSHYEDMTWSPSSRHFRSPGSSPETYRRIIHTEDDFPKRSNKEQDDDFFSGRKSPTFPRRVFKEVWTETPSNHRFGDRGKLFKKVFKPGHWEEDFDRDIPHIRRVERQFDRDFDEDRPMSRSFDDEFEKRFNSRDIKKDFDEEFQKAEGRVHHIPIMVEKRMEEMKSRFGKSAPPPEHDRMNEEEYTDEWVGPQVQNLRKTFEPNEGYSKYSHRIPKSDTNSRPRAFTSPISDTWDPHAIHTLPTRRSHRNTQSFDDSRHPISPKSVFRSYSETHEDIPKQQPQHSAAFRSHSDGHCPKQTYVTKIEVNLPKQKEQEELHSKFDQKNESSLDEESKTHYQKSKYGHQDSKPCQPPETNDGSKPRNKTKHENPSLQQIAVVLQNIEDLVHRVESYSGTGRDKQFRFLDEMLTRCMLRLDDVDTEGREDIRNARKTAVREVQNCIDMLEAKADASERRQPKRGSDSSSDGMEKKEDVGQNNSLSEEKELDDEKQGNEEEEQDRQNEQQTNASNGANEETKL